MQPSCQRAGTLKYHRIRDCKEYAVTWKRCMQPAVCVVLRVFQLIEGFYISGQRSAEKNISVYVPFLLLPLHFPHTLRSNARLSAFLSQCSRGTWHPHMVMWPDIAASGARHNREMFATACLKQVNLLLLFFLKEVGTERLDAAQ